MAGSANIADLYARLLLDASGLTASVEKEAAKAGDAGSKTLSSHLAAGLKAAAPAALAAGFALVAANLTKLNDLSAEFQAQTGATAEEAKSAQEAVASLYRTHLQGFEQIFPVLTKLRTEQGLNEKEAEALAGAYLDWSNVTKQDAATAVTQFDDVLDAFNLTAKDGTKVMDQLFVSSQKYGDSVTERLAALKTLAPALQGLNLTYTDGISLENLFASAGLDSATSLRALNTAIKNLKPGQTLNDLFVQISQIEDPTKRAQKAIEIFGIRGGTQLAQALRPGFQSLDDFKVSAEDAAGAVEDASKKIDGSIPKQFELFIHNLVGEVTNLAAGAGPIVNAVAGLGFLAVALRDVATAAGLADLALAPVAITIASFAAPFALVVGGLLALKGAFEDTAKAAGESGHEIPAIRDANIQYQRSVDLLTEAFKKGGITGQQYLDQLAALDKQYGKSTDATRDADKELGGFADTAVTAGHDLDKLGDSVGGVGAEITTNLNPGLVKTGDAATGAGAGIETMGAAADTAGGKVEDLTGQVYGLYNAANLLSQGVGGAGFGQGLFNIGGEGSVNQPPSTKKQPFVNLPTLSDQNAQRLRDLKDAVAQAKKALADNTDPAAVEGLAKAYRNAKEALTNYNTEQAKQVAAKALAEEKAAHDKAKAAAEAHARAVKSAMTDAYHAAKKAADDLFDRLHDRRLADIEETRKNANDALELQKKGLFAPVDAAQQKLDDERKRKQRQDLVDQITAARKAYAEAAAGTDTQAIQDAAKQQRDAIGALQDFDKQAAIDKSRADAQAQSDALTAQQQANDKQAQLDTDAENAKAAKDKAAFDKRLEFLEAGLEKAKSPAKREKILQEIQALYDHYGLDAEGKAYASGQRIADALAAGLKAEVKAVETSAAALAAAIAKYIKVGSPAEKGVFHDDPPDAMGARVVEEFGKGAQDAAQRLKLPAMAVPAAPMTELASTGVLAGQAAGGQGAAPHTIIIDNGSWAERVLGTPRFFRYVDSGLAELPGR